MKKKVNSISHVGRIGFGWRKTCACCRNTPWC